MPNYTPKYNLEKPLQTDFYNVDVVNANNDKIDAAIDTKLDKTANAFSATKLQTARTITVGNTGKTFDGSANQSWSLAEIGVVPYTFPTATSSSLGGVKVGESMTISADGTINAILNQTIADGRYVKVTGDTITGQLNGTTATFSGNVTAPFITIGGYVVTIV